MTAFGSILAILIICKSSCFAQNVNKIDSLKIMQTVDKVFNAIDTQDKRAFIQLSTDKIYCILCSEEINSKLGPYVIKREEFYRKYVSDISNSEDYKRAKKSKQVILFTENRSNSDITVLFTTWLKDEIQQGHEGGQFGILFKRNGTDFKFSGVETIP